MFKNKLKIFNYGVVAITLILFFLLVFNPNIYVSVTTTAITFILLSLFTFLCGIKIDKKETYESNIIIYIILYLIFLISLTMFIGRYNTPLINMRNGYLRDVNIIPFKTIVKYLTEKKSIKVIIYNIFGNLIAFVPLSFLLILKNDKNMKLSKQIRKISIAVIIIEILQLIFSCGKFDIDDFILNVTGALIFYFIFLKTNLFLKIKKIFTSDLNINKIMKLFLLIIILFIIIIFDILLIFELVSAK